MRTARLFVLSTATTLLLSAYGCSAEAPVAAPGAAEAAAGVTGEAAGAAGAATSGSAGAAAGVTGEAAAGAGATAGAAGKAGAAGGAAGAPGATGAASAAAGAGSAAATGAAGAAVAPAAAVAGAAAPMMAAGAAGAAGAAAAGGAGGVITTAAVAAAGAAPLVSGAATQGVRAAASMAAPPPAVTFAGAKSAEGLMSRGNEALGSGNHSGALDLFRKAAEAGPGLAGPLFGIAASLVGLGKNAAALSALSKLSALGTKASVAKLALAATSALFEALRSDPESKEEFERLTKPATAQAAAAKSLFVPSPGAGASAHQHYKATIASLDTFLSDPNESTCVSLTRKGTMSEDGSKVPSTSLLIIDCKTNKKLGTRGVLSSKTYGKLTKDGNTAEAIHGELSKTEDWLVNMNMTEWAPVNGEGRAKIQDRIKSSGVSALPQGELSQVRASLSGKRLASRDAKGKWRVFAANIEAEAKRVEAKKSCAKTKKSCIKDCWTECQKTMQCAQVMKCESGCRKAQKDCEAAL